MEEPCIAVIAVGIHGRRTHDDVHQSEVGASIPINVVYHKPLALLYGQAFHGPPSIFWSVYLDLGLLIRGGGLHCI